MDFVKCITDPYDRKARLRPALLLVLLAIVTLGCFLQIIVSFLQSLIPIIVSCGVPFLLTQLVRDLGKRKEKKLFELWGGMPSVAIFRYRDGKLDAVTKQRYHASIASKCKTSPVTCEEEGKDTKAADDTYNSWSNYLRANTRDTTKYHLLFLENVNYGYRRNVLGVRFLGIIISFVCLFVSIWLLGGKYLNGFPLTVLQFIPVIFSLPLLVCWLCVFNEKWVRIVAEEYAKRLVETIDVIGQGD